MDSVPNHMLPEKSFQGLILTLQRYWADYGLRDLAALRHGSGARAPFIRRPRCVRSARSAGTPLTCSPRAGRRTAAMARTRTACSTTYQFQVILKPSPMDIQDLYLKSLAAIGVDAALHDIRFVEDDWESPTLGAWGLGWECWCDGMEVSQFHLLPAGRGRRMRAGRGRTHLRHRAARDVCAGVDRVYDLNFNGPRRCGQSHLCDVFLHAEQEYSRHNFEYSDGRHAVQAVLDGGRGLQKILEAGWKTASAKRT